MDYNVLHALYTLLPLIKHSDVDIIPLLQMRTEVKYFTKPLITINRQKIDYNPSMSQTLKFFSFY